MESICADTWAIIAAVLSVGGLFATMLGFLLHNTNKLDADIKSLSASSDAKFNAQIARIDTQALRLDQLYTMFIDLLKEKK